MKLEEQVCSLELAKRLNELGIEQESLFYWFTDGLNLRVRRDTTYIRGVYGYGGKKDAKYSAFTVAELGEMLPDEWNEHIKGSDGIWRTGKTYAQLDGDNYTCEIVWANCEESNAEANARAKMLIYLIENSLIEVANKT